MPQTDEPMTNLSSDQIRFWST